jgi:hypothetical protein
MTDASVRLHNSLHLAPSGVVPCISLEKQPAMLHTMNMFVDGKYKNNLKCCAIFGFIVTNVMMTKIPMYVVDLLRRKN